MNRAGYDVRLSAGAITAGGTLGILIPPSIMLVVMGPILEVPVPDLFAAAIIPGFVMAMLYVGYAMVRCNLNPELGPVLPEEYRASSMWVIFREFALGLVPPAMLVGFALGSILFGLATPTEGAAMGAFGSFLLTLCYGKLTWKGTKDALIKTLEISVLILFLVAASNFFGSVFSKLGTPGMLTEYLLTLEMSPYMLLLIIMALIWSFGRCSKSPDLVRHHCRGQSANGLAVAARCVVCLLSERCCTRMGFKGYLSWYDAVHGHSVDWSDSHHCVSSAGVVATRIPLER